MARKQHRAETRIPGKPTGVEPRTCMRFIQLKGFMDDWEDLGLDDEDLRALETAIMAAPMGHPVIPGTGGLRKARFGPGRWNKGKSGSLRVAYVYIPSRDWVLLVAAYHKSEQSDISPAERKAFKQIFSNIDDFLSSIHG